MSGLLYYIDGVKSAPLENDLKECGLYGQKVGPYCHTEIFLNGTKGTVFGIKGKCSDDIKVGFYHDEQVWENIPKADGKESRLWIGYYRDNKPKPKDFLRKDYIDGYYLELADGNQWVIPVARRFQQGCLLPKGMKMVVAGRVDEFVIEKYMPLQRIAEQLFVHFGLDEEKEFHKEDGFLCDDASFFTTCVEVLSTNYNLDFRDVSILKLFTTDNTIDILKLVIDMPHVEKIMRELSIVSEKKTELLDTNTL